MISQSITENNAVTEQDVRGMLGLADKSKIITLIKEILSGKEKESIKYLKDLMNEGLDAKNFEDILEVLYLFSRRVNLGPIEKDMSISENEIKWSMNIQKTLICKTLDYFGNLQLKLLMI